MNGPGSLYPRLSGLVLGLAAILVPTPETKAGLIINASFTGGAAPSNMVGGGDLVTIFNTAVSFWEAAFPSQTDNWVVNLRYGWGPLDGINGQFYLGDQGGTPHRIESGSIVFNNSGSTAFFADPTPRDNSEYGSYATGQFDTPDGPLVISRVYSDAAGGAADRVDLLSIAEHEIGHALGLSADNTGASAPIIIAPPLPFAGEFIPSVGTDHLSISGALMGPIQDPGVRHLISPVDILAEAQISQFATPNLDPYAVPEPGSFGMTFLGLLAVVAARRRHPAPGVLSRRPVEWVAGAISKPDGADGPVRGSARSSP